MSTAANPLEAAHLSLIKRLLEIKAPKSFGLFPHPSDYGAANDYLRAVTEGLDVWLAAFGAEIRDNAQTSIDAGLFSGSFSAAIEGNETYACQAQAEALIEERRAMRRSA